MTTPHGQAPPPAAPTCPRHPATVTYVSCQRCGQPTCPACQVPAAVGVHCVDCSARARRERPAAVRRAQAVADPPYVSYGLTALVCLVYVAQLVAPRVTDALVLVPRLAWAEPWRLLTSALVHDPTFPLHLIGNALMLVLLGRAVEPALGHARYAVLCLLSALGGSVGVLWTSAPPTNVMTSRLDWFTPVLGISTVVYGVMCALLVLEGRQRGNVRGVATLLALNVAFSLIVPNVSWQGHLGGAVVGLASTWALTAGAPGARGARTGAVGAAGLVLLAGAIVARYALVSPMWGGFGG